MKGLSHTYTCYLFSPQFPSHPGCHITSSRVPCAIQNVLVIHLKYSSLDMLKRQWICQDSGKPRPPHISCSCRALAVSKGYSHWPFLVWKSRNVLRVFSYPPGSSVHGILQARLEWVAISYSRRSSRPRHLTQVSCIADRRFTVWATREA